jgi:hypothetical protein
MYSGFVTPRRTVAAVGVHQRFDRAAYRLAAPYFATGSFPPIHQIMHFEGINGPDGLKIKSPGRDEPGHLYNPTTDSGDIPGLIQLHYTNLVAALRQLDMVRAAFEAAWLAHYICDGLTPAHHFPLDERVAEQVSDTKSPRQRYKQPFMVRGETAGQSLKRSWALWGSRGLLSVHASFELGIATALLGHRIKVTLNHRKLATARQDGAVEFFKAEAREVAGLDLYTAFYQHGWTSKLGSTLRQRLAPQITQAIAIIWILAYLEAGFEEAKGVVAGNKRWSVRH